MKVTADEVRAWISQDPDPQTREELTALLRTATATPGADGAPDEAAVRAAVAELEDRFSGPLRFGTAGLRGALGGGPHRMNRAVVIRAAAGLCAFLAERVGADFVVVIGYDARRGSRRFAEDTAAVVTGAGGRALLLPEPLPTPVLAYAVRGLSADAGVMVTASHNPPQDNGYKVYLGGRVVTDSGQGAQIVPPYDAEIAERIAAVGSLADVPRPEGGWRVLGDEVREAYLRRAAAVPVARARALRIVLTPLHGVGGRLVTEALRRAGFEDLHVVPEQAEPDPDFPTVAFPNPEEPGALDLATDLARRVDADLLIANDPDADRCAVAVPDRDRGWRQLTGDEVGWLLGELAAQVAVLRGHGVLASSVVSSRMLEKIAAAHGVRHRTTLTGFKWISRVPDLVFGYEEALGYCVDPEAVRDKDGISAAVRIAELAANLRDHGQTLLDELDRLALQHGVHATAPVSVRVRDVALIGRAMARLRAEPPRTLGGAAVTEVRDLAAGSADLPPTDGLVLTTADGDRVIVRPSGTEPKLKCYLEVVEPVGAVDRFGGREQLALVPGARQRAAARLARLRADVAALVAL